MNSNKYLPFLVCGFGAAVLTTVPYIKSFTCCLIVPAAAFGALYLNLRVNNISTPIDIKKAILYGFLTGLTAAFFSSAFEILITYITHTNDFVESLPQTESLMRSLELGSLLDQTMGLLNNMSKDILATGFSLLYAFTITFSNLIIDSIFGIIGGVIGMSVINKRT
ncbi:MAG: hypothetical protein CO128_07155 [Ignavibacteriales bacterium CG_4_9_14_3_um_filter_30_11]|nr:MAG: hypothetical protein CO128_07155 [Ignavibacteriales bacterium CG_4_9_14_3_um_filter_30_11]